MSKVIIDSTFLLQLSELDAQIATLNTLKLKLIFDLLAIALSPEDFKTLSHWDLITVSVRDTQMAVQLNKLSAYIPNLKFVVAPELDLFTITPGKQPRRVWKER